MKKDAAKPKSKGEIKKMRREDMRKDKKMMTKLKKERKQVDKKKAAK